MKNKLIDKAIESFGGKVKHKNVFNTAGYQSAVQKEFNLNEPLNNQIAINHLLSTKNIRRLKGNCHWRKIND